MEDTLDPEANRPKTETLANKDTGQRPSYDETIQSHEDGLKKNPYEQK